LLTTYPAADAGLAERRSLPADTWSELARTYVGTDIEDNWNALFRTTVLFRRVGH
jgi:aminoglycoside 6-adenylyltransferase